MEGTPEVRPDALVAGAGASRASTGASAGSARLRHFAVVAGALLAHGLLADAAVESGLASSPFWPYVAVTALITAAVAFDDNDSAVTPSLSDVKGGGNNRVCRMPSENTLLRSRNDSDISSAWHANTQRRPGLCLRWHWHSQCPRCDRWLFDLVEECGRGYGSKTAVLGFFEFATDRR